MQIYLFCSYEHSQKGFYMTRLENGVLVPAIGRDTNAPGAVREFFSYERYFALYRQNCAGDQPIMPNSTGSFFGLRHLEGLIDGRKATANLAILAEAGEFAALRQSALTILGDVEAFRRSLFAALHIGGPCGYEADEKLAAFFQNAQRPGAFSLRVPANDPAAEVFAGLQKAAPNALTQLGSLHFALLSASWDEVAPTLGTLFRFKKPKTVWDSDKRPLLLSRGALWSRA